MGTFHRSREIKKSALEAVIWNEVIFILVITPFVVELSKIRTAECVICLSHYP